MAPALGRSIAVAVVFAFVMMVPNAAQQAQPAMSRSKDAVVGNPSDDLAFQGQAIATTRKVAVGNHAILSPYEQCGGEKGLCNTTTIGMPCGDHPWGLDCPTGYDCTRKTSAMWQCYPVLGKKDSADEGPSRFTTAPKGSAADNPAREVLVPISNSTASRPADAHPADSGDNNVTPSVKACKPGELSVGNLCVRSAAGSRRALSGTLAGSLVLLAAWQLAVFAVTAVLAC